MLAVMYVLSNTAVFKKRLEALGNAVVMYTLERIINIPRGVGARIANLSDYSSSD
jgi:hypothetical protein